MPSSSIIIEILLLRAFLWVSSTFSTIKSELPHSGAHFGLKAPSGMHLLNVSTLIWAEWHSLSFLRYVIYMKPKESFFNRKFSPCSSSVTGATFCLALAVRHKSRGFSQIRNFDFVHEKTKNAGIKKIEFDSVGKILYGLNKILIERQFFTSSTR